VIRVSIQDKPNADRRPPRTRPAAQNYSKNPGFIESTPAYRSIHFFGLRVISAVIRFPPSDVLRISIGVYLAHCGAPSNDVRHHRLFVLNDVRARGAFSRFPFEVRKTE
jgi:hypothetical protein